MVLVEQSSAVAFRVARRGYVLDRGEVAVSGSVEALRGDAGVQAAYLGVDASEGARGSTGTPGASKPNTWP